MKSLVPTLDCSQLPAALVLGDPTPSCSFNWHCTHICTQFFKIIRNFNRHLDYPPLSSTKGSFFLEGQSYTYLWVNTSKWKLALNYFSNVVVVVILWVFDLSSMDSGLDLQWVPSNWVSSCSIRQLLVTSKTECH